MDMLRAIMPRPIIRAPVDGKCRVCGSTEFTTRNRCKPCNRAIERARRANDVDRARELERVRLRRWRKENPDEPRVQMLRQRYGLTPEQLAEMLRAQRDACAVCGKPNPDCIDHCHETGRVRGVLCRQCNIGMGQFRDDPALLLAAALYIEEQER